MVAPLLASGGKVIYNRRPPPLWIPRRRGNNEGEGKNHPSEQLRPPKDLRNNNTLWYSPRPLLLVIKTPGRKRKIIDAQRCNRGGPRRGERRILPPRACV